MKTLKCVDLGSPECPYVAKGETYEEVRDNINDHCSEIHPDIFEKMTEEDRVNQNDKIKELTDAQK